MAQEWFYAQGDRKVGPVSVKELMQAAADGTLQPSDLVWTEGMTDWKEASTVKGLEGSWPSSPPPPPTRRAAKPVAGRPQLDTDDQKDGGRGSALVERRATPEPSDLPEVTRQWWLIGPSLFCCFPVGLVLVWMHPRLTRSTKWTISGVVGVLFMGMAILGAIQEKRRNALLAEADRVWVGGDKRAAVETYRKLLEGGGDTLLTDEQKPLVYGRVIDYDAESGNGGSAVKLAEKALDRRVEPSVNTQAGRAAVAEARSKRTAKPSGGGGTKKSGYTLQDLRDMFPVGTPSRKVYDTLGNPDRHDRSGFKSVSYYEKLIDGAVVMFNFEDGSLVSLDIV